MNVEQIKYPYNPKLIVSAYSGHFATRHSHNSHYIDITRMKHEHTMAREAAMTLAQAYTYDKGVDTIVCLDGSEVIGAFLARHLAKKRDVCGEPGQEYQCHHPRVRLQRAADFPG